MIQRERAEDLQVNKGQKPVLMVHCQKFVELSHVASTTVQHSSQRSLSKCKDPRHVLRPQSELTEENGIICNMLSTVSWGLAGLSGELAMAPHSTGNAVPSARTFSWDLRLSQPWLTQSTSRLAVSLVVPIRVSLHLV